VLQHVLDVLHVPVQAVPAFLNNSSSRKENNSLKILNLDSRVLLQRENAVSCG
jgi:hypothetical protein